MADKKTTGDAADYLMEVFRAQGVAVSTVKDGHLLMFKRSYLQDLLDQHPDQESLIIFLKRPDFQN